MTSRKSVKAGSFIHLINVNRIKMKETQTYMEQ